MSITRSSWGREQQINRFPAAGGSSGSGSYFTDPEINPHSQVWQTPVRQAQRTGTSQASASSSRLWNLGSQVTVSPARANEILGPLPGGPTGACGGRRGALFTPGMMELPEPKISVWMQLGATPQAPSPAVNSSRKVRRAAHIKIGFAGYAQFFEDRDGQPAGSIEVNAWPISRVGPAVRDVAPGMGQLGQQITCFLGKGMLPSAARSVYPPDRARRRVCC